MGDTFDDIFFRPVEFACERLTIAANLYNQCRLLLSRCQYEQIFVAVRSMQLLAVIDREEVIFVDLHSYAVKDGVGGRLIRLAWRFRRTNESLSDPAPIDLIHYDDMSRELHLRLVGEFKKALDLMMARADVSGCQSQGKKVLPFTHGPQGR